METQSLSTTRRHWGKILVAFRDSKEMINEEIQLVEELIKKNNIRIRDAAKWYQELVASTIDPAHPWKKTVHQQR